MNDPGRIASQSLPGFVFRKAALRRGSMEAEKKDFCSPFVSVFAIVKYNKRKLTEDHHHAGYADILRPGNKED